MQGHNGRERLRSATEGSKEREVSCKKCATTFGIKFRADLIHVNSVRGGYLDLDAAQSLTCCQGVIQQASRHCTEAVANSLQQLYPELLGVLDRIPSHLEFLQLEEMLLWQYAESVIKK